MTVVEFVVPAGDTDPPGTAVAPSVSAPLSRPDTIAIVARNHECVVRHELDDGSVRVHRLPYAWSNGSLVLPTWPGVDSQRRANGAAIECYVSELESGVTWRIAKVSGRPIPFLPTGDARERTQWRAYIDALRGEVHDLAPVEVLMLENYGVVRLDPEELSGNAVRIADD